MRYDINNDDSSKTISECEEFNSSSNITEEKNFSELLSHIQGELSTMCYRI